MNMQGTKDGCLLGWLFFLALVWDAHGFIISMESVTKLVNDDNFTVSCRDNETGLPVTWRSPKGTVLGEKTRPKVEHQSFGTLLIFVKPHKVEDSGNYTCSTVKDKRVFHLFVEPQLEFSDTDTKQTGEEGKENVIKCDVKGGKVSGWYFEGGGMIEESKKYGILGDGLTIRNVTRHDSKTYICRALHERTGTVRDRKILFIVKHKPVPLRMREEVLYGYLNGTVNLTCVAVAYPPATFEWKVSDKKQKIGQIINESAEVSILQLHLESNTAFGNYKCIAKNKYGVYEENFTLKKAGKPVPPSEFELKIFGPTSITFRIVGPEQTPEMDLETKGFSVQYKKIDDKEWNQALFNITADNLYTVENLDPNTEYEIQVATRNLAGVSDYLTPKRWMTSGATAPQLTLYVGYILGIVLVFENFNLAFW